jgi:predicted N-acetyltransferase YhbS
LAVRVRTYRNQDLERVTELICEAFRPRPKRVVARLLKGGGAWDGCDPLVVEADGQVVSSGRAIYPLLMVDGYGWRCGGVAGVCTASEHRGRGYATRLVKALQARMVERGATFSILFTELDSPAHPIYGRLGYFDIARNPVHVWVVDPERLIERWVWRRNQHLRYERRPREALKGWRRTLKLQFRGWRDVWLRFTGRRFKFTSPGGSAEIEVATDLETFLKVTDLPQYIRVVGDRWAYEAAVSEGRLAIRCSPEELDTVRRVLVWDWV